MLSNLCSGEITVCHLRAPAMDMDRSDPIIFGIASCRPLSLAATRDNLK
jgi:hypothetical protein